MAHKGTINHAAIQASDMFRTYGQRGHTVKTSKDAFKRRYLDVDLRGKKFTVEQSEEGGQIRSTGDQEHLSWEGGATASLYLLEDTSLKMSQIVVYLLILIRKCERRHSFRLSFPLSSTSAKLSRKRRFSTIEDSRPPEEVNDGVSLAVVHLPSSLPYSLHQHLGQEINWS